MKIRLLCFVLLFLGTLVAKAVPATILNDEAIVYQSPDFDSEQLTTLGQDTKVEVSQKNFGPFHRVRMKNGKMGYIADNDFIFQGQKVPPAEKKTEKLAEKKNENKQLTEATVSEKTEPKKSKNYSLAGSQLWGPNLSYIVYRESTMGINPSQKSLFFGAKFTGPDLFIEGDSYSEMNILVRAGAPELYAQATGVPTQGWIFMPDILMQNRQPQTKNVMTSYGYGLMFRYSKYDVGLRNANGTTNFYSLEDMVLGAVANAGFFYKIGQMTLRGEYKLYMEKMTYWGIGLGFLFPF